MTNGNEKATGHPSKRNRPEKSRFRKLMFRILLFGLAAAIVLMATGYALLRVPFIQHRLKALAVETMERQMGARLEIGEISGNILRGLNLDAVRLIVPSGVLISADRISIRYHLPMLLKRMVVIDRLGIDGLRLNLVRNAQGQWNFDALIPPQKPSAVPSKAGSPFQVLLKGFSVTGGTVKIDDSQAQPPRMRQFDEIEIDIALEVSRMLNVDFRHLSFRSDQPRIKLSRLKGRASYDMDTESITATDVDIETELSRLSFSAQILQRAPEPEITLEATIATLSLNELGHLLSVSALNRGSVGGDISLQGTPGRLKHRLKLILNGQALAAEGVLTADGNHAVGLETRGTLRKLNPSAWPLDGLEKWPGDINADFALKGENLAKPERQGHLNVQLQASGLAGYRIDRGSLDVTANNGTLTISHVQLEGPGGSVKLKGLVEGISETATSLKAVVNGEIRNLDTDTLISEPKLRGTINIDLALNAAGRIDGPEPFDPGVWSAQADLRILPSVLRATEINSGRLQADWNGKTLRLASLEVQSELGRASLKGQAAVQPLRYQVGGKVAVDRLKKTVLLLGDLLPRISENTVPDGRLELDGTWDGKLAQLKSFNLQTDAGNAFFKGRLSIDPLSYEFDGQVDFKELGKIVPLATELIPGLPADQLPNGHFRVSGLARGDTEQTDIRATLNVDGLTRDGLSVASGRLNGDWQFSGKRFSGRTNGTFTDIRFEENLFPRLDLTVLLNPETVTVNLELAKDTGEKLRLAGQIDPWQDSDRRIRIDTLRVTGISAPFDRLVPELINAEPILLQTHPDGIDIESLLLVAGPLSFQAAGNLALQGAQNLQLTIKGLEMEHLVTIWQDSPSLTGKISAQVDLAGTGESPQIDARVTVSGVRGYDVSFSNVDLAVRYRDGSAVLEAAGYRGDRRIFDAGGRSGMWLRLVPFNFEAIPGSLQAQLRTDGLRLAELPIPQKRTVKVDGLLTLRLLATGDLLQPQLTGSVSLREGSLVIPRHGLTYESVQADIKLLPGKLTIDEVLLRGDREGMLTLGGDILMDGWSPSALDLNLTGKQAPVSWKREITVRVDPDISLKGPLSALVLTGRLRIPEGRINLDRMMAGGPADIEVLGDPSTDDQSIVISESRESLLSSLAADLAIDVPRNVWLKGQQLNAEIAGNIKLIKKPQAPFLLVGSLSTVRGNYLFQDRRFEITRGMVEFQGLEDPDPLLDIRAETGISDVKIIIRITGSARMIELSLESEPMMDRADIISYLVFGRPTNELRSEQATSAQAAALDFAGRAAVRELNQILGDTLKVDEIRIDPGAEDWQSGSLTLGKYVARNIFMTYRLGFSSQSLGQVGIEYELNRHFSVEAEVGDERSSGVDLIWKTDF